MSVFFFIFEFELFFIFLTVDFVKMSVVHFLVEVFLMDAKQHWEQLHCPYVSICNGNLDLCQ